jgi:hypothetical protein
MELTSYGGFRDDQGLQIPAVCVRDHAGTCRHVGAHTLYTAHGHKITCADGQPLVQYRGGALRSCTIEKAHTFGDVRCEAPARIEFEPDGRLRDCQPS